MIVRLALLPAAFAVGVVCGLVGMCAVAGFEQEREPAAGTASAVGRPVIGSLEVVLGVAALVFNLVMLVGCTLLWWWAARRGWLELTRFVAHVSMLALVATSAAGLTAAVSALVAGE